MRALLVACLALPACVVLDPLEGDDPAPVEPAPQPAPQPAPAAGSGTSRIAAIADRAAPGHQHWQLRDDREHTDAAIEVWTAYAAHHPNDAAVRIRLARAHVFLAEAFLRDDATAQLNALDAAIAWGEGALVAVSPEFSEAMRGGAKFSEAAKVLGVDAVPALYWYTRALEGWARRKGFAVLLGQKDNLKAAMEVCLAVDPTFFHGGPERAFGSYLAVLPAFAGGDLKLATAHYEQALSAAPDFAETKLQWAVDLALKQQDRATFERLLAEVLDTPDDAVPGAAPETRVTKARAREWLEQADDLF